MSDTDTPTIEATRERNASAVRRLYQCDRDRDLETWASLWNPEGRATFPACDYLDPVVGVEALKKWMAPKHATRGKVEIRDEILPLVDPTRILACVGLSFERGGDNPPFEGVIWVLFTFDDDGLILEHAEMFDTVAYRDVLMRPTTALPMNLRPGSLPGRG